MTQKAKELFAAELQAIADWRTRKAKEQLAIDKRIAKRLQAVIDGQQQRRAR